VNVETLELVFQTLNFGLRRTVELGEQSHTNFGPIVLVWLNVELEVLFESFSARVEESFPGPDHIDAIIVTGRVATWH